MFDYSHLNSYNVFKILVKVIVFVVGWVSFTLFWMVLKETGGLKQRFVEIYSTKPNLCDNCFQGIV